MKFETINSCDNCLQRKFRMKINEFSEFLGVASPEIYFNDLSFQIAAFRHENELFFCKKRRNVQHAMPLLL